MCVMDVRDFAPSVSPDGSKIVFRLSERTGFAECAISREALEAHFWLPAGADEVRMLNTFADGCERIIAVAERKRRARPDQPVRLTIADFVAKR
jgi:Tol biopolymer transport system component